MSNIMRKLVEAMRAIKATLLLAISRPATARQSHFDARG
jgi:hypothetical protein